VVNNNGDSRLSTAKASGLLNRRSLTLNTYTHLTLHDLTSALESLPPIETDERQTELKAERA